MTRNTLPSLIITIHPASEYFNASQPPFSLPVRGIKKEQIILVVGDITQKVKDEGEHDYFVEDMISHTDFNSQ